LLLKKEISLRLNLENKKEKELRSKWLCKDLVDLQVEDAVAAGWGEKNRRVSPCMRPRYRDDRLV
jgi:hypothetical protein